MGWDSFGVVRFDLGPLLQGQTRIAKRNSACISLICVPRGLQCHTNLQELWAKNLLIWSDLSLGFSKVKHVLMALVSFLSCGYNLHRFSDVIGLVNFVLPKMAAILNFRIFAQKLQNTKMLISRKPCYIERFRRNF